MSVLATGLAVVPVAAAPTAQAYCVNDDGSPCNTYSWHEREFKRDNLGHSGGVNFSYQTRQIILDKIRNKMDNSRLVSDDQALLDANSDAGIEKSGEMDTAVRGMTAKDYLRNALRGSNDCLGTGGYNPYVGGADMCRWYGLSSDAEVAAARTSIQVILCGTMLALSFTPIGWGGRAAVIVGGLDCGFNAWDRMNPVN